MALRDGRYAVTVGRGGLEGGRSEMSRVSYKRGEAIAI